MWMARCCRATIAYRVSRLQSSQTKVKVSDLQEANKVILYVTSTPDHEVTFTPGVIDWNNMIIACVTNASHANEMEVVECSADSLDPYRSQGGKIIALATANLATENEH